jgi:hypothetical protein
METQLRPATRHALQAFRARRRTLLAWRALLCFLLIALTAALVVALLDRARFLPEALRPWTSLTAYAIAALAAWRTGLNHLREADSDSGAARLLESLTPDLHERLLAAVELAEGHAGESAELRARLQEDVATAVSDLNVRALLPARTLRAWLLASAGLILGIAALSCIPALHLPGFLTRAVVPFANLPRPASVVIHLLEPRPADTLAAFHSEIAITAEVSGRFNGPVQLESQTEGERSRFVAMRPGAGNRYEASINVSQTDLRYRLHAGDAISPWHQLSARPRPRLTEFTKILTPPAYTGLPASEQTGDNGDIEALEGSTVRLILKANQPVSNGSLQLNPDHAEQPEPLAVQTLPDGRLQAEWTLAAGQEAWQIALTAVETGFTNEETSPWHITPIPDLPPIAQILEPQEQVALLADATVRLQGFASDDVGLAAIAVAHAVNGGTWEERPLAGPSGREAGVQSGLPLAPIGVTPGDTVLLKLIATDLKGQKAESPVVRVMIQEQTIDPRQRRWAEETRRLAQQADALADKARTLRKAMDAVQKSTRQQRKESPESSLARAQTELSQVRDNAEDLWERLKQAAAVAPGHLEAEEMRLVGERLAHLRHAPLAELNHLTEGDIASTEPLRRQSAAVGSAADAIAQALRAFAIEDGARITAQTALQLSRQGRLLTDQSLPANRDTTQRPKWQEQQRAALLAADGLQRDLENLQSVAEGSLNRQLTETRKQLGETAADLGSSLDKPEQTKSPEHLYGASDNHRQRLQRAADALSTLTDNAASNAAAQRERLAKQDNPALTALNEAQSKLKQAVAEARNPKARPKRNAENLGASEQAQRNLAQAARQLEDQGTLREQNPLTNRAAALDTNRASRAADQLARELAKATPGNAEPMADLQEKTRQLTAAARLLETDALAQTAAEAAAEAAAQPDPTRSISPDEPSRQSRAAAEVLRQLPDKLRRLGEAAPPELTALAPQAQQASEASRQNANQLQALARQAELNPGSPPAGIEETAGAVSRSGEQIADLARQFAETSQTARATLAGLTPQVSTMMQAVAEDIRQKQQQTQAAARQAEAGTPVAEVAETARELQAETADQANQMATLQAALRQEANAADLQQQAQRQMARTADVALAQMQRQAPQIARNLRQAAQAAESQPQAQALQNAATAQEQTAQALQQLAENLARAEQGEALSEQELAAMQNMEQELGVQEALEEAYQRAQQLAEMARDASQNPAAVLAELEKELPKNPAMQKALAEVARQTAQSSEQAVADEVAQPVNLGLATEQAAHDLARVARHAGRLGMEATARQAASASSDLQRQAQAAKGDATQPGQQPVGPQAQSAASEAAQAVETAASALPPAFTANPFQQIQAALLAKALDQLDQTLHPMSGNQSQQSGQQQQQGGSQQQAQQSLADAQQSQQQAMANQRNQGQTPGSQQPSRQNAQTPPQQNQNPPPQSQSEGGNLSQQLSDGEIGAPLVRADGDWGHLPGKMAADLSEATRTEAAPEYRAAIESYYKAIATKARK